MRDELSKRRLAENELVFKQANTQVIEGLSKFKKAAAADGHHAIAQNVDSPLHFFCECSDERCRRRIVMKPSKYIELHKNKRCFIIKTGHEVPSIERVIFEDEKFTVVQKFIIPKTVPDSLNITDVDNSRI